MPAMNTAEAFTLLDLSVSDYSASAHVPPEPSPQRGAVPYPRLPIIVDASVTPLGTASSPLQRTVASSGGPQGGRAPADLACSADAARTARQPCQRTFRPLGHVATAPANATGGGGADRKKTAVIVVPDSSAHHSPTAGRAGSHGLSSAATGEQSALTINFTPEAYTRFSFDEAPLVSASATPLHERVVSSGVVHSGGSSELSACPSLDAAVVLTPDTAPPPPPPLCANINPSDSRRRRGSSTIGEFHPLTNSQFLQCSARAGGAPLGGGSSTFSSTFGSRNASENAVAALSTFSTSAL